MIVKQKDGYIVKSKDGKKLAGPYKTKAEKRLAAIEYFKNVKKK